MAELSSNSSVPNLIEDVSHHTSLVAAAHAEARSGFAVTVYFQLLNCSQKENSLYLLSFDLNKSRHLPLHNNSGCPPGLLAQIGVGGEEKRKK